MIAVIDMIFGAISIISAFTRVLKYILYLWMWLYLIIIYFMLLANVLLGSFTNTELYWSK